ncbi:endonuclease 8-like 1 [Protopterus annectens]|uniref:endonuclease 8-like 1 n=1 Tax=Protopterus annectens TaxID=7888 RepID=UPI001CF9CEF3|nr:endonuclease 8-like 1 [Protopterus annectens]XP_043933118.1 endonuclease 8-like 1 [Protopterus annectens]XP_043933119.1 endonuclease 8-like 1 [Protopterus annectens]
MPEGPDLHLASCYINKVCSGVVFSGAVVKSEVSKNPEVPFASEAYTICSESRGKEIKLTLSPIKEEKVKENVKRGKQQNTMASNALTLVFRFGMSGHFRMTSEDEIPKHAHLRFYTKEKPRRVLSFVDIRRFGSWEVNGSWQPDRGPCVMFEYEQFRANVLNNLSNKAFEKPICEVLLNQKYFNGIGNYLRAEILFRLKIPPFTQGRAAIELSVKSQENSEHSLSKKVKVKMENPDILELCHSVPLEVVNFAGDYYEREPLEYYSVFSKWLQCYYVAGMKTLRDSNGRTIWFQGEAGPMAPKGAKVPKRKYLIQKQETEENDAKSLVVKPKIKKTKKSLVQASPQKSTKTVVVKKKKQSKELPSVRTGQSVEETISAQRGRKRVVSHDSAVKKQQTPTRKQKVVKEEVKPKIPRTVDPMRRTRNSKAK